MKNEIWVFSPPNWRHILMIYVGARELGISLTKIEFVSISGSYCVRVTTALGCFPSSQIKTVGGDINETIPGYRSHSHIHCPDSPPGFPEMSINIRIWGGGREEEEGGWTDLTVLRYLLQVIPQNVLSPVTAGEALVQSLQVQVFSLQVTQLGLYRLPLGYYDLQQGLEIPLLGAETGAGASINKNVLVG